MTTREKIIVGVMCLTIAYGGYELIGSRTPKRIDTAPAKNTLQELRTFVADLSKKLVEEKVTEENRHVIRQAATQWQKDPFIISSLPLKSKNTLELPDKQPAEVQPRMEIVYTGYLDMGGRRIAILNGMEYSTGEKLDISGLYVKAISPREVTLGKKDSPDTIQLPLQETETGPEEMTR